MWWIMLNQSQNWGTGTPASGGGLFLDQLNWQCRTELSRRSTEAVPAGSHGNSGGVVTPRYPLL